MKLRIFTALFTITATGLFLNSCAKDTIEAELFGDIEGIVVDGGTQEGISAANITTSPASNAIFSENDGTFSINNIPTGNYTIQVRKKDYSNASVSVAVREGQTALARIAMNPIDEDSATSTEDFQAEITSWFNDIDGDSTYVDVNFRVTNSSETSDINEYEVYFEFETQAGTSFYFDISGESLRQGQSRNGNFKGYIRNNEATDVFISDVWISQ